MPDYVIRHRTGFPDEVVADSYEEKADDLVFIPDDQEILRIPRPMSSA